MKRCVQCDRHIGLFRRGAKSAYGWVCWECAIESAILKLIKLVEVLEREVDGMKGDGK